jgi:hypothetical protein
MVCARMYACGVCVCVCVCVLQRKIAQKRKHDTNISSLGQVWLLSIKFSFISTEATDA